MTRVPKALRDKLPRRDVALPLTLVVYGEPVTKKNHPDLVTIGGKTQPKRTIVMPSAPLKAWTRMAVTNLVLRWPVPPRLARPLNLNAQVYRSRRVGDLGNYLAAICDMLQAADIVDDDKWIMGHDGSRLCLDIYEPRVTLTLTDLETVDALVPLDGHRGAAREERAGRNQKAVG